MEIPKEQVTFTVHPPVEFIYALNFTANEESLYKFYLDFNFSPSEELRLLIEEMKSKLSKYMSNELIYFFEWQDMLHILGRIILENETIKTTQDLIRFIEQICDKELLSYIIRQALYSENDSSQSLVCWSDCQHIAGNIRQLISDMDDKTDEDKEKLMECVENPSEIKARLCLLMTQFYEKCYKPVEHKILIKLESTKEKYERLLHEDPDYFDKEFLGNFSGFKYERMKIHISYFTQIRPWLFHTKPYNDTLWVNLGIYTDQYPRKMFTKVKVQKFVKLLSDKKRFEMVEMLGKKPHYVYELAAALELTPPTVSYHLTSLTDLNLLRIERKNNRAYYSLDREIVRELLKNAEEVLLA